MKLKKLEIVGFKSFQEKAAIDFPPGISAIVGPNGCGKSNILDALRWVMGEQSVKQLRGKSMEDVIFAGTNGKAPLNMAEVSLTLANDNGSAPEEWKDFSEIMITRRLFRSGESAYLINKHPCRLKDIHNIFLGSGMGAKSYAVIQQGNIGAITDAGPEERRVFIEEAAGVTRYKQQKHEALQKIGETDQNLLRIRDIISEVEKQMAGLKRQAKKAEVYNRYQDRIRELDLRIAFSSHDELTAGMAETEKLLAEFKDADLAHSTRLKKLDAAVEEIKLKRWQKDQEISGQKAQKFEVQRQIDRIENDLSHLRKDVESLESEIRNLTGGLTQLEEKNRKMAEEMAVAETENRFHEEEIRKVGESLAAEREASRGIEGRLEALRQELEQAKSAMMNLAAQEARYHNIFQNASNNRENLKRRLKRIDEEEVQAQNKVRDTEKQEVRAREELESLKAEIEDMSRQADALRKELDDGTRALGNQVKGVQTLELERGKVRSRYSALKKMEDNFEWYREGVRAVMKPDREGSEGAVLHPGTDRVRGLVADALEPEAGFESAVEAVLGDALQYILVEDPDTGRAFIDYLRMGSAGRCGFIPASSIRCPAPLSGASQGSVQILLDHVRVKPGFEEIAGVLLGDVAVAGSLAEGMGLWEKNGTCRSVVTREGDLINAQGILIGGSRDKLSGILGKKHELRDLETRIAEIDRDLEEARRIQKELEAQVRSREVDLQKLGERKNRASRDEMEGEKGLYRITEDLKHARRHLEIVKLEQDQLLGEESDIDAEMSRSAGALAGIQQEIKAAEASVAKTSGAIQEASGQMEAFNQKTMELKLTLTTLSARLENGKSSLRRLKDFHEDGIRRLETLTRDISQKKEKKGVQEQRILENTETLSVLYDKLGGLERTIEAGQTDYQAIDARLKESTGAISDLQTERERIANQIRTLEMEQSHRQLKRENIENRIFEKYQRSLAEFRKEHAPDGETAQWSVEQLEEQLSRYRKRIAGIGEVNVGAIQEYGLQKERHEFLMKQHDDLVQAVEDLHKVIRKINRVTQERFLETFTQVNEKLQEVFPRLFEGGSARLELTDPEKPLESGVEFMIHPPGKKLTRMSLLSGGEKALAAISFIFSIFLIKPASFCMLDEIDAPLDEANVFRFNRLLKIIGENSQIVMITHNKRTMEFADTLFGITMEKRGVSKLVAVNLIQAEAA